MQACQRHGCDTATVRGVDISLREEAKRHEVAQQSPWTLLPPLDAVDQLVFVLLGPTGLGKSHTANKLVGVDVKPGSAPDAPFPTSNSGRTSMTSGVSVTSRDIVAASEAAAGSDSRREPSATLVGPNVVCVDTPGFRDTRNAVPSCNPGPVAEISDSESLALTDSGICLQVCQALSDQAGATALLLFVSTESRSLDLERHLLLLQHFYGASVWSRVLFVFRGTEGVEARMLDWLREGLDAVAHVVPKASVVGARNPLVLAANDTPDVVLGRVLWTLVQAGVPLKGADARLQFSYGESLCSKCGATNDERMLEALTKYEAHVPLRGPLAKCHPEVGLVGLPVGKLGLGSRVAVGFAGVYGSIVGVPASLLLTPFNPREAVRNYLSVGPALARAAGRGFLGVRYCELCTDPDCMAQAMTEVSTARLGDVGLVPWFVGVGHCILYICPVLASVVFRDVAALARRQEDVLSSTRLGPRGWAQR
jgi:hypothetical protein